MAEEPEALIERRGRAGFIVLNRPRALDDFERDPAIARVVIVGAGGRAFCAGGDIRKLYEQGRAGDHAAQLTFWREEYILDQRIKRYSKPYVALVDGVVMGGGVGVGMLGSHRVVSERCVFAMPEVGIGFFPDVGASWLLPRLPHRIGVFLSVTGLRAAAGDLIALGLATTFAPSGSFQALERALEEDGSLEGILARFSAPAPPSPLMAEAPAIESAFAQFDLEAVRAALADQTRKGSQFAAGALAALSQKSPTSQAIALRQMALGGDLSFEAAMAMEYRIVSRICRGHDFYEGVRATIVDKDNRPDWRPGRADLLSAEAIDAYFAPLGADELTFTRQRS